MNFVAVDVETANPDLSSICQIGIVRFADGKCCEKWESLVDPEDYFDAMNVSVHGIDESKVIGAPKFPEIQSIVERWFCNNVLVIHTHFDRSAIGAIYSKYRLDPPPLTWLDSARVVRRTWNDFSQHGYGLKNVAQFLGIDFEHHNAVEDARAAGEIMLQAIQQTGLSISDWLDRVRLPIGPLKPGCSSEIIARDGNPEGPLFGESAVFTGTLSMPRREAADLAAAAGCDVTSSVSKSTTLLIVGDQDVRRFAGNEKSSKHRKAEEMIAKGQVIRILRETDFLYLIASNVSTRL